VGLQEVSHQADNYIAAEQDKDDTEAHRKGGLYRGGNRQRRTHAEQEAKYRILSPQADYECFSQ
jgi:hypothetical protein